MTQDTVLSVGQRAIEIMLLLSLPVLGSALVIGILVGMFQAATQINEATLSFIPKLLVMAIVIGIGGPWMLQLIRNYTIDLFSSIPGLIG